MWTDCGSVEQCGSQCLDCITAEHRVHQTLFRMCGTDRQNGDGTREEQREEKQTDPVEVFVEAVKKKLEEFLRVVLLVPKM